jgi:hypothetical protein
MSFPAENLVLVLCAVAFAFMGAVAIAAPTRVTAQFDIPDLSVAGRNEVRAVYGGFGLCMCAILIAAIILEPLRAGICVAVGAALAGMAGGRMLSAIMDRSMGGFPLMYMTIEICGAALLFYAA